MTAQETLERGLAALGTKTCPQAVDKQMAFCARLLETNKVMNLTGAVDAHEVVTRHLLDCAAAYAQIDFAGKTVVDVGTGAGFPGMPLALLHPDAHFTLLDSLGKRITFLKECIEALGLTNAEAVHARAEEFAAVHRAGFDFAVSRAVADLRMLSELCLPLVKVGGAFLAMKSANAEKELADAQNAVHTLGGEVEAVRHYLIPGTDIPQRLVLIRKTRETPGKYPRRFAKIASAPL